MARRNTAAAEAEWRARFARFDRYEGTVLSFCKDEGVSDKLFYYWRKRLRPEPQAKEVAFVEVARNEEAGAIELVVGAHVVRMRGAVDKLALETVLDVLAARG